MQNPGSHRRLVRDEVVRRVGDRHVVWGLPDFGSLLPVLRLDVSVWLNRTNQPEEQQMKRRRIFVSAVLSVLLLAALAANVHAAEVKITASDGAADDWFGTNVAISGDYAVVSAHFDDGAGSTCSG